jgi:hypothetical protein
MIEGEDKGEVSPRVVKIYELPGIHEIKAGFLTVNYIQLILSIINKAIEDVDIEYLFGPNSHMVKLVEMIGEEPERVRDIIRRHYNCDYKRVKVDGKYRWLAIELKHDKQPTEG